MGAYYRRTVATNGLLIGDPHEAFEAMAPGWMQHPPQPASGSRPHPDNSANVCLPMTAAAQHGPARAGGLSPQQYLPIRTFTMFRRLLLQR